MRQNRNKEMHTEGKGYKLGVSNWKDTVGNCIHTDGCILLFCEEGMAVVSVGFKNQTFRKGDVALIFPDIVFIVIKISRLFSVRYIELSPSLFDEATGILSSSFFDRIYDAPVFHTSLEQQRLLEIWGKQFVWITQCPIQKSIYLMLRNHMQNFFIGMESIVISEKPQTPIQPFSSTRWLFNSFCRLLVKHCHVQHNVKFYAEQLNITPYYLSKITGKTLNVSPKELIDRQIVMEMKQLLVTTDISIKDLAARFHFDTMSYMARFFRRHTGLNPNDFRKQ